MVEYIEAHVGLEEGFIELRQPPHDRPERTVFTFPILSSLPNP